MPAGPVAGGAPPGAQVPRRGTGREVSLAEFPLAQQFSSAETVRAEEITLSVPDGRSVKMLINATPIRSADGEVETMVVTMQDLARLEELERQRAEFLGMVSHELRAPLTSIKGSTTTVLSASPGLDPGEVRQFVRIIDEQADHMRGLIADLLDAGRIETGTLSASSEPVEVVGLVEQARNTFPRARRPPRRPPGPAAGDGRPAAHRPGPEQPYSRTRRGTRPRRRPSSSTRLSTACMSRSR